MQSQGLLAGNSIEIADPLSKGGACAALSTARGRPLGLGVLPVEPLIDSFYSVGPSDVSTVGGMVDLRRTNADITLLWT